MAAQRLRPLPEGVQETHLQSEDFLHVRGQQFPQFLRRRDAFREFLGRHFLGEAAGGVGVVGEVEFTVAGLLPEGVPEPTDEDLDEGVPALEVERGGEGLQRPLPPGETVALDRPGVGLRLRLELLLEVLQGAGEMLRQRARPW